MKKSLLLAILAFLTLSVTAYAQPYVEWDSSTDYNTGTAVVYEGHWYICGSTSSTCPAGSVPGQYDAWWFYGWATGTIVQEDGQYWECVLNRCYQSRSDNPDAWVEYVSSVGQEVVDVGVHNRLDAITGVLTTVQSDLQALRLDVQSLHIPVSSMYVFTTSQGAASLEVYQSATVGDLLVSGILLALLIFMLIKMSFGALRGISVWHCL